MIREWKDEGNAFQYEEKEGRVTILAWKGAALSAAVPERIGEAPVERIGRKAFLSNKRIQEVRLPESIREIDDWAFAYCSRLARVWMPRRKLRFGKGAFLQCGRLEEIRLTEGGKEAFSGEEADCFARLLAGVVWKLDEPYLLAPEQTGSGEWIEKWDRSMRRVLLTPDRDGYSQTILCGEEDYGSMDNNLDYFLSQKRRSKARLAMLRLLNPIRLSEQDRLFLEDYLLQYTKGHEFEETWQVVKEEHGTETDYYDLLFRIGAINEENFDAVLCDMGAALAEMKAYLLRKKEELWGGGSFFTSLSLEL